MTINFTHKNLPLENVYGHTKKLSLIRQGLAALSRRLGRGARVLDVGCGNGEAVTRYLAHAHGHVLGIDLHGPSIDYAQKNFGTKKTVTDKNSPSPQKTGTIEFSNIPAEDLLDDSPGFDAVIFADVLEHVDDPNLLLRYAKKMIHPQGRIFITIPNGFGPFECESFISHLPFAGKLLIRGVDLFVAVLNKFIFPGRWNTVVKKSDIPYNEDSPHVRFFTMKHFLSLVASNGYIVKTRRNLSVFSGPFTNYFFAPSALFCRWNNRLADKLPSRMTSAWFFELEPGHGKNHRLKESA